MEAPFLFGHFNHLPGCRVWVDTKFKDYIALNYAHSGVIRWALDCVEPINLKAPVAWWTWAGPHFRYGQPEAPGWDHYYVTVKGRWTADLLGASSLLPSDRPWQAVRDAAGIRERMEELQHSLTTGETWLAWTQFLEVLVALREDRMREAIESPPVARVHELIATMRRHPERAWDEVACAVHCGMSPSHFRRIFRVAASEPFARFAVRSRMEQAARWLRTGTEPVKDIAARSGVPDIYQFSRQFRRVMGTPPATYRREARLSSSVS